MKRIVEESSQNVNSNAGIFLAKQILDSIPSLGKFDSCQPSAKSLACQTYSNSGIAKAEVALMTLGKTSFCDIADHQTSGGERLPVDVDVSVMVNDDCRKEGVGFTYHRILVRLDSAHEVDGGSAPLLRLGGEAHAARRSTDAVGG